MELKLYNELPNLKEKTLELAVSSFVHEANEYNVPLDKEGWYTSLMETLASVLILKCNPTTYVWLAIENEGVKAFAITGINKDVDNSLTYWIRCAWIAPETRTKQTLEWYSQFVAHAKKLMCKHVMICSFRNPEAYKRLLGKDWHTYSVLLKKDL